jgi:hypothetical protein
VESAQKAQIPTALTGFGQCAGGWIEAYRASVYCAIAERRISAFWFVAEVELL